MPSPESARRKCGICSPDKKWPKSRRKRAVVADAVEEQCCGCGRHEICPNCLEETP